MKQIRGSQVGREEEDLRLLADEELLNRLYSVTTNSAESERISNELAFRHWFHRSGVHGPEHPVVRGKCVCLKVNFPDQKSIKK